LLQEDPEPLMSAELFEADAPAPIVPEALITLPPLETTREFPEPLLPTVREALLLQVDPEPVMSTELLEAVIPSPIVPEELKTVPPLETVRELEDPLLPMESEPLLLRVESDPEITMELPEDDDPLPIMVAVAETEPPSDMLAELEEPLSPTMIVPELVTVPPDVTVRLLEVDSDDPPRMMPALERLPELLTTREFPLPAAPIVRVVAPSEEFVPVTTMELFEEFDWKPI
jgi:hypothetical protein